MVCSLDRKCDSGVHEPDTSVYMSRMVVGVGVVVADSTQVRKNSRMEAGRGRECEGKWWVSSAIIKGEY